MLSDAIEHNRRLIAVIAALVTLLAGGCTQSSPDSLIASGKEHSAKDNHKAAVIQFKAALQLAPGRADARVLLGKALLAAGELDGAVVELTKAMQDASLADEALPLLSTALLQSEDYKKLVNRYSDVALQNPVAQATLKTNIAVAWNALGDSAKREAALAAAASAVPNFGPAQLLRVRLLANKGQFDDALTLLDAVLADKSASPDAWQLRGEMLSIAKADFKGAEVAFRHALVARKTYAPAYASLIAIRLEQRDLQGAKRLFDDMRLVLPNHPVTAIVDAQLALLDQQPARARELVQRLLVVFPENQGILLLAGAIEAQLGAATQAAAYFGKALHIEPSLDVARRNLAATESRLGQHARALQTLKPLLTAASPKAETLSLAGDAELRMGNAEAAERYYLRAARLDPENSRLQTVTALMRMSRGDSAAGLAALQAISNASSDTYAEEALFAARLKRREYELALETLDAMAKKRPNSATVQELQGQVHLARRDLVAARQAFDRAHAIDSALFGAVSGLVTVDLLEGKYSEAIRRLEASVAANPGNSVALVALAELKARQGSPISEVKKLFADAVAASPTADEPRLRLIDFLLRRRQFKDALTAAQEAVTVLPANAQVLEAAGLAQMRVGDFEQAANTFRKLAAATPNSPGPYMRLAEVYTISGKPDKAETAVSKALELDPDMAPAQAALVELLVASNRRRDALEYIRRIKQAKPRQSVGYALEAAYHLRLRDTSASVTSLREGLTKTGSPELAGRLYKQLVDARRTVEADQFAAQWMKQHPEDAAFEYLLAERNIVAGDFRLAEERLRRVVAATPNNALALNNLAWLLVNSGGKGALGFAQRAIDISPDQPVLLDTLASALAAEKQLPQAIETQRRAVELAPDNAHLKLNLAKLALLAGDKGLARAELQTLQKLGADFDRQAEVTKLLGGL